MKIFLLLPVISLIAISDYPSIQFSSAFQTDTTTITHLLDGNITEWPEEKFTIDKTTKIRYAIDNDSMMLFLAINISDKNLQQAIMQNGMSLFIDIKGKKKENRGVEFPLGMENNSNPANSLGYMKIFGFTELEPFVQTIKILGTINIATVWDNTSVLNIEYNIPMQLLERTIDDLKNKNISLGWKIKNTEITNSNNGFQPARVEKTLVGRSASGTVTVAQSPGSNISADPFPKSTAVKSHSIWTTHTIIF